jgi:hypothetical protein
MGVIMIKNKRVDSYIFTADCNSADDMLQINIVKKTVRASNRLAMQNYKSACKRAEYYGEQPPEKPMQYRVRLMGRGARKVAYQDHVANGGHRMWQGFSSYLPQKYAERFDVYVHEVR